MDVLSGLAHGFGIALQPLNLLWCLVGCVLGTVVGIMPGLGPPAAIAMLLPVAFNMDPTGGIIMLSGIYYGAKYGGSTTSILLNIPGEASSVATCLDGYQMARNGRAGAALGIAAIASFVAGTFGVVLLTVVVAPIARFALSFSSPEYFALLSLGLALVVLFAGESPLKAALAMLVGLWLTSIGIDLFSAQTRFTFGQTALLNGIDFMIVAIGVFAVAEVLGSMQASSDTSMLAVPRGIRNLLPNLEELKACRFAFINGSITGFIIGVLPGAGSSISSFIAYALEKLFSKHPERFGQGAPEGVAAPEAANNADTSGAMVPMLTLGLPGGGTTAILLSALVLWGLKPGPMLMQDSPNLFWGLVASMYIGNLLLLLLNLPLVPLFAQALRIPSYVLFPMILGISVVGVFGVAQSIFHVGLLAGFGLLGYAMARLGFPGAPLILGFVLGDGMERALRQSLQMSGGDLGILVSRPIAAGLLVAAVLVLMMPLVGRFNRWRLRGLAEGG
jgi:putative tricarboxylic transport membrane protein